MKKIILILILMYLLFGNINSQSYKNVDTTKVDEFIPGFDIGIGYISGGHVELEMIYQFKKDFGIYINANAKPDSKSGNVYDNINYYKAKYYFGDTELGDNYVNIGIGAGINFQIMDKVYMSAGMQYQSSEKYTKFYDKYMILGDMGTYYVKGEKEEFFGVDFGLAYKIISDFYVKMGYILAQYDGIKISIGYRIFNNYTKY